MRLEHHTFEEIEIGAHALIVHLGLSERGHCRISAPRLALQRHFFLQLRDPTLQLSNFHFEAQLFAC